MHRPLAATVCALHLLALAPARADASPAQNLFDEAMTFAKSNDWSAACPKFEQSLALEPGLGVEFYLADCYEHVGRTGSAYRSFRDVESKAKARGEGAKEKKARERATALEPKLSYVEVRVVVGAGVETVVTVDRVEAKGPTLVDPGDHALEVKVGSPPAISTISMTISIASAGTTVLTIPATPATEANLAFTASAAEPPIPTPRDPAPAPVKIIHETVSPQQIASAITFGVGVVSLGLGVGLGLSARAKFRDADAHCLGDLCDAAGARMSDDARRQGRIATLALGVGAAAMVGGAILWLTAPKTSTTTTVGLGPQGIVLAGSF